MYRYYKNVVTGEITSSHGEASYWYRQHEAVEVWRGDKLICTWGF